MGEPRRPLICESSAGWGSDKGIQSLAKGMNEETQPYQTGFGRSSGCARVSLRLQKLTSSARSSRSRVNNP